MTNEENGAAPSRRLLLTMVGVAVLVGALIVVGAVLPAEFGRDPLGTGRLTGLADLWQPPVQGADTRGLATQAVRDYPAPFRSDVITIPIADFASGKPYELEYKVRMRRGATLLYSWTVSGASNGEEFYTEFHGHTVTANKTMTVAEYKKASGLAANGALVAPFDGVHGWFFQNSAAGPVVVHLRLSGFYDLIPPGQIGNEARIIAPAAR